MSGGAWVFGYGSLVAPASLARTIGRQVDPATDVVVAHLAGFGRRWNYGSLHLRGDWVHDDRIVRGGLVVSLGLVEAPAESCNGVIVRVDEEELAALDWRERDYERTDVTDRITTEPRSGSVGDSMPGRVPDDAPLVTYVPRPSAVERYLAARDDGTAAIRASYWATVHEAFDDLGGHHRSLLERTPAPDVPVADITLRPLD